jgi:hypothetical protein
MEQANSRQKTHRDELLQPEVWIDIARFEGLQYKFRKSDTVPRKMREENKKDSDNDNGEIFRSRITLFHLPDR